MAIRAKFGNRKTEVDGITFDSKREAERYCELKLLLRAGVIKDLVLQPEYELWVNGVRICKYRADFAYQEAGERVVEDVKGYRTREYNLKRKLMKAIHGIDIQEVR